MRALALPFVAVCLFVACDGQELASGLREPIRVKNGQFIAGNLPTPTGSGPTITNISSSNRVILPGQAGKVFDGRVTKDASSLSVRLADLGTGYWVFVPNAPDAQFPGELGWGAELDFSLLASQTNPGFHTLQFVSTDGAGNVGAVDEVQVCFAADVPDNLNSCDPTRTPPAVVIQLGWDRGADVDLEVVTPDGRIAGPKHPATEAADATTGQVPATAGLFDHDSLGRCVNDSLRQENLVFQTRPTGTFDLYANLFDGCGQAGVRYTLKVFEAQASGPGQKLVQTFQGSGLFTSYDANGGSGTGTLVTSVTF